METLKNDILLSTIKQNINYSQNIDIIPWHPVNPKNNENRRIIIFKWDFLTKSLLKRPDKLSYSCAQENKRARFRSKKIIYRIYLDDPELTVDGLKWEITQAIAANQMLMDLPEEIGNLCFILRVAVNDYIGVISIFKYELTEDVLKGLNLF